VTASSKEVKRAMTPMVLRVMDAIVLVEKNPTRIVPQQEERVRFAETESRKVLRNVTTKTTSAWMDARVRANSNQDSYAMSLVDRVTIVETESAKAVSSAMTAITWMATGVPPTAVSSRPATTVLHPAAVVHYAATVNLKAQKSATMEIDTP
jgi:hypothetical protein